MKDLQDLKVFDEENETGFVATDKTGKLPLHTLCASMLKVT